MEEPKKLCSSCNNQTTQTCSRCHSSRYCSKECQVADYHTHKLLCRGYSTFDLTSRPTPEHKLGFFFSPDQREPQIMWIHFPWQDEEYDDYRYQVPDCEPFLGAPGSINQIQCSKVLKRQLSDTIRISFCDRFLKDGSKPNFAIHSFLPKDSKLFDWRGPILAYGMKGLGMDQEMCRDLDLNDFKYIVDYMITYDMEDREDGRARINGDKVKGVKINCEGDKRAFGLPEFETIDVPTTHPIFTDHGTSEIAERIKIPIFTRKYPPNSGWKDDGRVGPFLNQAATFLHLACTDNRQDGGLGWGWAPVQWQNRVGSVLVVRQDRKPLHPLHMEALARFCQYELGPMFEHSMGGYGDRSTPLTKGQVLGHATVPFFELFWSKVFNVKLNSGCKEARDVWDPYQDVEEYEREMEAIGARVRGVNIGKDKPGRD